MWRHYLECMSIWIVNLPGVWGHSTLHNIHMDIDMDMRINHLSLHVCILSVTWSVETLSLTFSNNTSMWRHYIECTSIQIVNLHGLWRHSTLCNIHMDTNMDMDMECIISHMECGDLVY